MKHSPSALCNALLLPLLLDPAIQGKRELAEYLLSSPACPSLASTLASLQHLPGPVSEYLVQVLSEACASPDALAEAIDALAALLGEERVAPQERFGTQIRALVLLTHSGSFEALSELYEATLRFCAPGGRAAAAAEKGKQEGKQEEEEEGEARQSLERLHAYFDHASRQALEQASPLDASRVAMEADGHPPRSASLIQHAVLELSLLHERLGNASEAVLAANEAVLVAHQQGDQACLLMALDVLRRLGVADVGARPLPVPAGDAEGAGEEELGRRSRFWDLAGQADLAALVGGADARAGAVRLAYARQNRGSELDRLVQHRPARDAAAGLRVLASAASNATDAALARACACSLAHRLACGAGDLHAAAAIRAATDAQPRLDELVATRPWEALAELRGAGGADADVARARLFGGKARGLTWALRAWSRAGDARQDTLRALAAVCLARVKHDAGRFADALALLREAGPQLAAHAPLQHQGHALLLQAKCVLAGAREGEDAGLVLPLLGEAVRRFQEACHAQGFVEALYWSARVLHECGRLEERDKVAARWLAARRRLHRPTGLGRAVGDLLQRGGGTTSGLDRLSGVASAVAL